MLSGKHSPRFALRPLGATVFAAILVAGLGWGGTHRAQAEEAVIVIKDFSFTPPLMTIPEGATVTWINEDDEPHTVVGSDGLFKSHALDTDDTFSFTFSEPGRFEYFCSIHTHMVGTIVVPASQRARGRADLRPITVGKDDENAL